MRLLLRFSEQTDVSTDINTDFYVTEEVFCKEEVFVRVFCFVIVMMMMMMMMMLRKAVRSIL